MKTIIKAFANVNIALGFVLIIMPMVYLVGSEVFDFTPEIVTANDTNRENEILTNSLTSNSNSSLLDSLGNSSLNLVQDIIVPTNSVEDLGANLKVSSIGIDTTIYESYLEEQALEEGVWRMPQYGTPADTSQPTVLASHRWGQESLDWRYRNQHRFLNLTNVETGDLIEIDWNGEAYKYRITGYDEATYLTRTDDLILITCKYLESDTRIIVYAEKIS